MNQCTWRHSGTYDVQRDANRPFIPVRQRESRVPRVLELKVGSPVLLPRPQRSLEVVLHLYVCPIAHFRRLVRDRPRFRYARVIQCRAAGREHDVVDVPRI